ncbi:Asp-tRNA(Asn)/Glu-tRNA(Gln) amidotransferase subunit GatC [bacterium]|nr:Asp-tRNA(Asn)/Glu-tRNA(Gln) amidotransferase subunit GatC [bacterium]
MKEIDVKKVAELARINVNQEQEAELKLALTQILKHFEGLKNVNTDEVEPLFHFQDQMPLREDLAEEALKQEELLKNAPNHVDGCFRIPKVIGDH